MADAFIWRLRIREQGERLDGLHIVSYSLLVDNAFTEYVSWETQAARKVVLTLVAKSRS